MVGIPRMLGIFSKQKQTPEEIKEIRQAREKYQNYLSNLQTTVNAEVNSKQLTPESGKALLTEIKKGYDWLQKTPNANLNEIMAKYEGTSVEVSRIIRTDAPKRELFNMIAIIPVVAENLQLNKQIDKTQLEKLKTLAKQQEKWYTKNSNTATQIDISQEILKMNDTIVSIVPDSEIRSIITTEFDKIKAMPPSDLMGLITKTESDIKVKRDSQVDVREGVETIMSTAVSVFLFTILIAFCLYAGSLAANFAISRPPAYRILYFIYGSIPLFSPLVYLYTIYRRISDGPMSYYGFLPISVEPGITRLGKLLWYPFYYVPDNKAIDMFDRFKESIEAIKG
jgi:hypothetical protein